MSNSSDHRDRIHASLVAAGHSPEEVNRLIGDLIESVQEAEYRRRLDEPTLRSCLHAGCLRQFDMNATMTGRDVRPGWSAEGWKQVRPTISTGYICPAHAPLMDDHQPRWGERVAGASVLTCACEWTSPQALWPRYAVAAWQNHLLKYICAHCKEPITGLGITWFGPMGKPGQKYAPRYHLGRNECRIAGGQPPMRKTAKEGTT